MRAGMLKRTAGLRNFREVGIDLESLNKDTESKPRSSKEAIQQLYRDIPSSWETLVSQEEVFFSFSFFVLLVARLLQLNLPSVVQRSLQLHDGVPSVSD